MNPDAPVWRGEIDLERHRGRFTSQVAMKQGNRRLEHLLVEAETWLAIAALRTAMAYPYDELQRLWRGVLLNQFHGILPGSSIAWVHREARELYRELGERAQRLITQALQELAGEGEQELVANPAPHARRGIAATGIAPASTGQPWPPVTLVHEGEDLILASAHLQVVVRPEGTLRSVRDLAADREVIAAGSHGNVLEMYHDTPNDFDAWDIDAFYMGSRQPATGCDAVVTAEELDGVPVVLSKRSDWHRMRHVSTCVPTSTGMSGTRCSRSLSRWTCTLIGMPPRRSSATSGAPPTSTPHGRRRGSRQSRTGGCTCRNRATASA